MATVTDRLCALQNRLLDDAQNAEQKKCESDSAAREQQDDVRAASYRYSACWQDGFAFACNRAASLLATEIAIGVEQ